MKFGIYLHPQRPKVPVEQVLKKLQRAGVSYSPKEPDVAVVVGGDGTFGYYGRTLDVPLLFVGVHEHGVLGSRAKLAEVMFDKLEGALRDVEEGRFALAKRRMIRVGLNEKSTDVLTDVYVERGVFSGCMRYTVFVNENEKSAFTEHAIGNGVIFSTAFGSQGYYSYPNRLAGSLQKGAQVREDQIGICHVLPTLLVREKGDKRRTSRNLRYAVPFQSRIQVSLFRDTDTRLYGTTAHSRGVAVKLGDTIAITGSDRVARIIKMNNR
ncbi:hypothetical protein [Nitrososphaera sp.]|uniref:hypothetical protein n=1 Tax=Nitrososphaera sp. TaxID=1971748 RepID=UPI00317310F5